MSPSRKCILICGGAGYIGSHMNKMLSENGFRTVVFDNLSTGHRKAVKWGSLFEGDLLSTDDLERLFGAFEFDAVMHFSALSIVGDSTRDPANYYRNNILGAINLLDVMRAHKVNRFIFSSTAAVYGQPKYVPIDERHPRGPINPYGRSKAAIEDILADYCEAYQLNSVALRYFNAAGADTDGEIGEDHQPETHLIPNILKSILKEGPQFQVFGDDYDTKDGTCVRDYVHVNDICEAHLRAISFLEESPGAHVFNLGTGKGFTVLQIIRAVEEVTGKSVSVQISERRAGDPPVLVASCEKAAQELGWIPKTTNLHEIISTAWRWHKKSG